MGNFRWKLLIFSVKFHAFKFKNFYYNFERVLNPLDMYRWNAIMTFWKKNRKIIYLRFNIFFFYTYNAPNIYHHRKRSVNQHLYFKYVYIKKKNDTLDFLTAYLLHR